MPDTIETMQVELVANLQPLMDQLKAGLEAAKARLNAFKGEPGSKVELSAETKAYESALNAAITKGNWWRSEIENDMKKAGSASRDMGKQVESAGKQGQAALADLVKNFVALYLTAETARRAIEYVKTGIIDAAQEQREINGLAAQFQDMGLKTGLAQAQVEEFTTAMKAAGFEDDLTRAAIMRMLPVTGDLTQAIDAVRVAVGWNIKYNKDFNETLDLMIGLIAGSQRALLPKTLAEYGIQIDRTRSVTEQCASALAQLTQKQDGVTASTTDAKAKINEFTIALGDFKKGVGGAFLPAIESMRGALDALVPVMQEAGENSSKAGIALGRGFVDVLTTGGFELALMRLRDMADRLNAVSKAQAILARFKGDDAPQTNARQKAIDEEVAAANVLLAKLKGQAEVDAANKAEAAWKKSMAEAKKAAEDFWKSVLDKVEKGKQAWVDAAARIRMESLAPQDQAEAKVRIQAFEDASLARQQIADATELANMLGLIERNKQNRLAEIRQEFLDKEKMADQKAVDEAQRKSDEALQRQQAAYQKRLTKLTEPFRAFIEEIETKMNAPLTALAQRVTMAMTAVSNGIRSMLMGMRVSWSQVLRSMIVDFVMIFVNKFLAYLAGIIVAWVTGETAKTTASATGAAAQTAAAAPAIAANQAVASSAMSAAIAEIFAAHSYIPFAGVAIATGFSIMAESMWAALSGAAKGASVAFATGGLVDRPTFGLVGEAGPEIIAPVSDFKSVVQSLLVDTVQTVRDVAAMAGQSSSPSAVLAGAGAHVRSEMHLHGFAMMDTGRRGFVRQTARLLDRAAREDRRLTFGGGDVSS